MLVLAVCSALYACKPEDPSNEQEVITSVVLNVSSVKYAWRDIDGPGGNAPVIDQLNLKTGVNYSVTLSVLNESDSTQVKDLTSEVMNEKNDHRLCFDVSAGLPLVVTILDLDDNTRPVGLTTTWVTGQQVTGGSVTISLKHQPGVKDGTCIPGETDVEVTFPVSITD